MFMQALLGAGDTGPLSTNERGRGCGLLFGFYNSPVYRFDLRMQAGQFAVDGLSDNVKVHFVLAVQNLIAHGLHRLPWNVVVLRGEGRRCAHDVVGRLANDLGVSTYGILIELASQEGHLVHVANIVSNPFRGLQDVPQLVGQARHCAFLELGLAL